MIEFAIIIAIALLLIVAAVVISDNMRSIRARKAEGRKRANFAKTLRIVELKEFLHKRWSEGAPEDELESIRVQIRELTYS